MSPEPEPARKGLGPSKGLGALFWSMIIFGFVCILAGAAVAWLGPTLFPARPPPRPAAGIHAPPLGKPAPPR